MKKYMIYVSALVLLLCGCSNTEKSIEKLSNNILINFNDLNYIDKRLNKKEKQLIINFKEKELKENKIINLTELGLFEYSQTTNQKNTKGVWKENNNWYIKYNDINFIEDINGEVGDNGRAIIICDKKELYLSKADVPLLYEETKNINRYNYTYLGTKTIDSEINMYYKSFYDSTGLVINYKLNKKEIVDINIHYDYIANYNLTKKETKKQNDTLKYVMLSTGIIGLTIIIMKKLSLANKI